VFLCWSGRRSHAIATAFGEFVGSVIQAAEPWISSDIQKGSRWQHEVGSKLSEAKVGIVCLTPENLTAPWICFESGALAKTSDAHVCTFLHDVQPTDVKQPLSQFQHTLNERSDVLKLMMTINKAVGTHGEKPLPDARLESTFTAMWPTFELTLSNLPSLDSPVTAVRTQDDVLREILEIVRKIESNSRSDYSVALGNSLLANPDFLRTFSGATAKPASVSPKMLLDKMMGVPAAEREPYFERSDSLNEKIDALLKRLEEGDLLESPNSVETHKKQGE
jgi:hypothetical protein